MNSIIKKVVVERGIFAPNLNESSYIGAVAFIAEKKQNLNKKILIYFWSKMWRRGKDDAHKWK